MTDFSLGYVKDPDDMRDHPIRIYLEEKPITIPSEQVYEHPSPIKNQGSLGSCVGFACAALKEWQENRQRPGTPFTDVSEAWIYWKSKEIDPWGVLEEGTSFRYALKILQNSGVPTENCWRYAPVNSLEGRGQPVFYAPLVAWWARISNYARISTLQLMKESLCIRGPFLMGIECFKGIYSPAEGVVSLPKKTENSIGGHAILIMGYDDRKKLMKFRNSWGTNWGSSGYGFLPYSYVEKYCMDAWSVIDR